MWKILKLPDSWSSRCAGCRSRHFYSALHVQPLQHSYRQIWALLQRCLLQHAPINEWAHEPRLRQPNLRTIMTALLQRFLRQLSTGTAHPARKHNKHPSRLGWGHNRHLGSCRVHEAAMPYKLKDEATKDGAATKFSLKPMFVGLSLCFVCFLFCYFVNHIWSVT